MEVDLANLRVLLIYIEINPDHVFAIHSLMYHCGEAERSVIGTFIKRLHLTSSLYVKRNVHDIGQIKNRLSVYLSAFCLSVCVGL